MPFVGTGHIWMVGILLIVVLIIWGPGKLPDVGAGIGRGIREFRKASAETKAEFVKVATVDSASAVIPAADATESGAVAAPPG